MTLECTSCGLAWFPQHTEEATCQRCSLRRRLEEVERERDALRAENALLADRGSAAALAAERAAHKEARREQDIAARGRLDAEIRAERAEAALRELSKLVWHRPTCGMNNCDKFCPVPIVKRWQHATPETVEGGNQRKDADGND